MCRIDCYVHEVHARNPGSLAQLIGIYIFNKVNAIISCYKLLRSHSCDSRFACLFIVMFMTIYCYTRIYSLILSVYNANA